MSNPLLAVVPEQYLIDGVEQSEKVLGRGAFGVVFEGQWRGTKVAIKRHYYVLVRDDQGQLSTPFKKFLEEFPLLKELPHPNIVQVFGMVPPTVPQDTPGLVMEFLQQTLRRRYDDTPPLSRLGEATVALGVVSALAYLHGRNVVHRDLTTNNIMVCDAAGAGGELKAKVTDVGAAAMLPDGVKQQSMTLNPGAQIYMAPETRRRSKPGAHGQARYGTPADCYSYAVSVMAMCNRREPPDVFTLIEEGRARDLESLGAGHPLRATIVSCLAADPDVRPTALELCREIVAVQLSLKKVPAEEPTAEAVAVDDSSDEQRPESPKLMSAQAQLANLRREMAAMCGRSGSLVKQRNSLLLERDELTALNSDLQRAGTDAARQQDNLMTDLLVEQDSLMDKVAHLRCQCDALKEDYHEIQHGGSRQLVARQADMLKFIATQTSDTGLLARCSLIRPINLSSRDPATLPKWVPFGAVQDCQGMGSMQCVIRDRLFVTITSHTREPMALSAPFHNMSRENWTRISLPTLSTTKGFVSQGFFAHNDELYVCSGALAFALSHIIWRRRDRSSTWERVARMPQYRSRYALAVVNDCLVVAGGSASSNRYVRARPDVISLNLVEDGADWVAWPEWPASSPVDVRLSPNIAVAAGQLHIIGGELPGAGQGCVLTANLCKPPRERVWSSDVLEPPPTPQCAAVVVNDHVVVCGGQASSRSCRQSYLYSPVSKAWLPLPDILTSYIEGIRRPALHSTDHGILMVSHHGIAGLLW